jgi:hypothetical protein
LSAKPDKDRPPSLRKSRRENCIFIVELFYPFMIE